MCPPGLTILSCSAPSHLPLRPPLAAGSEDRGGNHVEELQSYVLSSCQVWIQEEFCAEGAGAVGEAWALGPLAALFPDVSP